MRKIVQIAMATADGVDTAMALADDGSLWWAAIKKGQEVKWGRIAPIPQDQPPAKEAE